MCNLISATLALMSGLLFVGCRNQATSKATHPESSNTVSKVTLAEPTDIVLPGMQANPLESTNIMRSFIARGVIRELADGGRAPRGDSRIHAENDNGVQRA